MRARRLQLSLDLRPPSRWGGRRPGAGRKPGPVRRDPHRRRVPLAARHPCHVTVRIRKDVASLRIARLVRELEASFRIACERPRFRLVHYSIQSNHVHLIVEAASNLDLASGMKSIGSRLARVVNRILRRQGPVLDDRYHLHVLRTPREVRNAIAYVLLNRRRHLALGLRRDAGVPGCRRLRQGRPPGDLAGRGDVGVLLTRGRDRLARLLLVPLLGRRCEPWGSGPQRRGQGQQARSADPGLHGGALQTSDK